MIPRFRAYLFDVDGTLLDSAPDICAAVRETLAETGVPPLSDEFLKSYIGHHLAELFNDVLPDYSPEQIDELIKTYRRIYPARGHRLTRIYPGVEQMLVALEGLKSTATTKSTETATIILRQFGLVRFFNHVQGTDGFPSKPEPDVILKGLAALEIKAEDCLLVGDSAPDMQAGRRAGVVTCAATWGYGSTDVLRPHAPDFWIDSPAGLLQKQP